LCKNEIFCEEKKGRKTECADSRASEVDGLLSIPDAYIKIDVEGFEGNIIKSAQKLINTQRPIVGFEALSHSVAQSCPECFKEYFLLCSF